MTCKNCGASVSAGDKFCHVCGISTAENNTDICCNQCGQKLEAYDRFCPHCGSETGTLKADVPESKKNISASRLYYQLLRKVLDVKAIILVTLLLLSAGAFLAGTLLNWWRL